MRWYKSGRISITAADLALLTNSAFKGKAWTNAEFWMTSGKDYPPISSAVFFALLSGPPETNPKMLWKRYREVLEVSNNPEGFYRTHHIMTHGKERVVVEPLYPLANYQKWILKNILERIPVTDYAYAYRKGSSLIENARVHQGHSILVKLDISHFFDSITYGMIYGVFSDRLHYPREGATLLANLCCLNGKLPQGTCTSPYLSNLCFSMADKEIAAYCEKKQLSYSRYSDDLTFSGDEVDVKELISIVKLILQKYGFRMNYKKIHVEGKGRQHRVTGIVCNDKINTPAYYRRQVRQEMYFLKKHGAKDHLEHMGNPCFFNDIGEMDADAYCASLLGRIAYILQVDPDREEFIEYRNYIKEHMARETDIIKRV